MNSEPPNEQVFLIEIQGSVMERHELAKCIALGLIGKANTVGISNAQGEESKFYDLSLNMYGPIPECEHGVPYRWHCEECD